MRYKRAVEKLRILAGTCERAKIFWSDTEPFLRAVYAFGEVLDGADPLDAVQVAAAINLPPEKVPWESDPDGTDWLANELRRRVIPRGEIQILGRAMQDLMSPEGTSPRQQQAVAFEDGRPSSSTRR